MNSTAKFSQLLTPTSLISSSTIDPAATPIRSRTNSLSSNSSILTNAANLLTDTPNEYSYLDSTKVNAFINEINNNTKLDDILLSPLKLIRKRRLSIEYPFPFLVEQAKRQRMTPKKLREELLKHGLLLRPPSPEYIFPASNDSMDSTNHFNDFLVPNSPHQFNDLIISNSPLISKRQRAIDFRHLQTNMQQTILKHFEVDNDLFFSEIYSNIHQDNNRQTSSSDIGICFAALLNNAVRYQLVLESNDIRDDVRILPPVINNNNKH